MFNAMKKIMGIKPFYDKGLHSIWAVSWATRVKMMIVVYPTAKMFDFCNVYAIYECGHGTHNNNLVGRGSETHAITDSDRKGSEI